MLCHVQLLMVAAQNDNVVAAKLLIKRGGGINARNVRATQAHAPKLSAWRLTVACVARADSTTAQGAHCVCHGSTVWVPASG